MILQLYNDYLFIWNFDLKSNISIFDLTYKLEPQLSKIKMLYGRKPEYGYEVIALRVTSKRRAIVDLWNQLKECIHILD